MCKLFNPSNRNICENAFSNEPDTHTPCSSCGSSGKKICRGAAPRLKLLQEVMPQTKGCVLFHSYMHECSQIVCALPHPLLYSYPKYAWLRLLLGPFHFFLCRFWEFMLPYICFFNKHENLVYAGIVWTLMVLIFLPGDKVNFYTFPFSDFIKVWPYFFISTLLFANKFSQVTESKI